MEAARHQADSTICLLPVSETLQEHSEADMERTQAQVREEITELTRQWEAVDKNLWGLRTQILQTVDPQQQTRWQAQLEQREAELRGIEEQLAKLEHDYQNAARENPQPESVSSPETWRLAYVQWLYEQCSRISLVGIDRKAANQQHDARLTLGSIYTALLTIGSEGIPEAIATAQERSAVREDRHAMQKRRAALAEVNTHDRLVLLGSPGSGKSTFVNFVALCLAGEHLQDMGGQSCGANLKSLTAPLPLDDDEKEGGHEGTAQAWDHGSLLPVRIILRDFAARGLPAPDQTATEEHLWQFLDREFREASLAETAPLLREWLAERGGLLLFDGLDEVPEAETRRRQILDVVNACAQSLCKCRIVVTSRTYAYKKQEWGLDESFREAVLANFSKGQIRYFIDHWYEHVGKIHGLNDDQTEGQAELLKDAISHSERLGGFAERPLLLTLMASLHAWSGGSLPEKREELYHDAVELLLDWWESRKIVRNTQGKVKIEHDSLADFLKVGKDRLRKALDELAFEAHKSQSDLTGTADIAEKDLINSLMRFSRNPKVRPAALVQFLSERAGLLVPRGVGVYTFPHRTFQEYLAACALTDGDDFPDNVADAVHTDPERWREVALLAGAKAARGAASSIWLLTDALCYQDSMTAPDMAQNAWGALLAAQALVETADLSRISPRNAIKLERVRRWLAAMLTEQVELEPGSAFPVVERALAGRLLARLGDPRPGVGLRDDGLPDIEWCQVEAGEFMMGSDPEKDPDAMSREQPQHPVRVSAFKMSRYPITNAQYQAFVDDGGERPGTYREPFGLSNHPVVGVSWDAAAAFCEWFTKSLRQTGQLDDDEVVRLPSEAEWEYAARGKDGHIYPWGNEEPRPELANYDDTNLGETSAVGCFPQGTSVFSGCEEMAGNVWEWCLDAWHDSYDKAPNNGSAWEEKNCSERGVQRGSPSGEFFN